MCLMGRPTPTTSQTARLAEVPRRSGPETSRGQRPDQHRFQRTTVTWTSENPPPGSGDSIEPTTLSGRPPAIGRSDGTTEVSL